MQNQYDVTILTVRPATQGNALAALERSLAKDPTLLTCWYSEIGVLNQILIIKNIADPAAAINARMALINSSNPLGVGEFIAGITMDTYIAYDFLEPMQIGKIGPIFEVRRYTLKIGGQAPTTELWRKAAPARAKISPILTAMTSVTGDVTRFVHIWPYASLEERSRLRAKSIAGGVWPPPSGPDNIATQQTDIYLPAPFSPIQ
jgi:NIPSNAP